MICPHCMSDHTEVYNSRPTHQANQIWRRRRCLECGQTFTSYERADLSFLRIEGKPYQRSRLYQSVLICFDGQNKRLRYVDDCVDSIEAKLIRQPTAAISHDQLVAIVLQTLRPISRAAWLQYLAQHDASLSDKALKSRLK